MKEKKFKTGYKWIIFWLILLLIGGGCGYIVYSKQVPQFEFPFNIIQPKEKIPKKEKKIEIKPLSLSLVDDISLRDSHYKLMDNISNELSEKNMNELSNPELLSSIVGKQYNGTEVSDFQEISQNITFLNQFKSSFYKIDISGIGAIQNQDTNELETILNLDMYFVYKDEQSKSYLMDINFDIYLKNNSEFIKLDNVEMKEFSNEKLNLKNDNLLNQHSTFLTEWSKFQKEYSNEKLFNELNIKSNSQSLKDQNLNNFIKKSNFESNEGLKKMFMTSNGNLKNAILIGSEVSNYDVDGNTYYLYATSNNEKVFQYEIVYNRLSKKITDIREK